MLLLLQIILYFSLFTIGGGLLLQRNRLWILNFFKRLGFSETTQFLLPAYALIMIEESMVGSMGAIRERLTTDIPTPLLPLMFERSIQFISLNFILFSGLVFGIFFATRLFHYSVREIFLLAGTYSLISEKTISNLINPEVFSNFWTLSVILLYSIGSFFTYGVIFYPSALSVQSNKEKYRKNAHFIWRYLFAILLIAVLTSAIIQPLSTYVRIHFDFVIPPENFYHT